MLNINKVRRIVKAQFGLSVPSGNPYITTNGLAIPGNSITQQNLPGTDYGAEFRNMAKQIMAPTNKLIDFNAKMGDLFSLKLQNKRNNSRAMTQMDTNETTTPKDTSPSLDQLFQRLGGWNTASQAVDLANNLLFSKQHSKDSAVTTGLNNSWNTGAKIVSMFNPGLGFAMGVGSLVANTARSLGTGTDQQTGFDKFGDSTIGQLSGIGLINGALGRKTRDFSADKATIEQVGGSYGGTVRNINEASEKAGKKYGLFSSGKRKQANRFIDKTESQQSAMTNIAENASDLSSIAANMSDLNHMQYGFNLNGGYDQRYMRAAKFGAKLKRVKRINFHKQGGEIVGAINLDNWQPVITEAVEQFENGGELEWTPVITFKDGGEIQKNRTIEQLIEYAKQQNPRFIQRLSEPVRFIEWEENGKKYNGTHLLGYEFDGNNWYVFPSIQEINGELKRFTDPFEALDSAKKNNNFLIMSKDEAKLFTESGEDKDGNLYGYKAGWPEFFKFQKGGKTEQEKDSQVTETTQKNIIPEGALHAHKHHMENADNLTKKGIPVVDNEGEQQAEIEKNEIIFTLEVTKKLEELYSKYYDYEYSQKEKDEVAIEAGKLLVEEILFNTEDRTSLIEQIQV